MPVGTLTSSEWHDSRPQIMRVEGTINAGKWDSRKTSFKFDMTLDLLLFLGLFKGRLDNITKHLLNFLNSEGFCQLIAHESVSLQGFMSQT
jgi:hypothetical protein